MGDKQPNSGSGTKSGSFQVDAPVGKASAKTTRDASNPFKGRSNNDVAMPSGLRGRESIMAYNKGRSYGK